MGSICAFPILWISGFLRSLSLKRFNRWGCRFGHFLQKIGFRTKIVEQNLKLAFGVPASASERAALQRRIYENVGTSFLEIARNFTMSSKDSIDELIVPEATLKMLKDMQTKKQGAVFISAHMANWELFASGISSRGFPVSAIVKKMSSPVAQELIERRRQATGIKLIYTGGTLAKMAEDLKEGRFIGFMVDQHMPGNRGIRVNFFGKPASSIRGLAKLVRETNCKIIPMCAVRRADGLHEVICLPALKYLKAEATITDSEQRLLREEWLNTQNYQKAIEQLILQQPAQWSWIHRRWKACKVTPMDQAWPYAGPVYEEHTPLTPLSKEALLAP